MAVDSFLKFASIKGESKDSSHPDEVEVLTWNWGAHNTGTMHSGTGGGTGKVDVQDMSITKYVDNATPNLWLLCCNGKHEDEAVLTVRKAGGDSPVEYLKITLKQCMVSDVQLAGADGGGRATETVTLNFAEFKMVYTPQDEKGAAGAEVEKGWNIRENVEP